MKGKEDHEYMLNILLKENEKYRNTLKEQSNNKSETIYGTILAFSILLILMFLSNSFSLIISYCFGPVAHII